MIKVFKGGGGGGGEGEWWYNGIDLAWGRYVLKQKTEPIEETSCVSQKHLDYKVTDIFTTD